MFRTVVDIDGMMCGMCESHVNDAVRNNFKVKKVSSSHGKGRTVIESEAPLDEGDLRRVIGATGYEVQQVTSEEVQKKRPFWRIVWEVVRASMEGHCCCSGGRVLVAKRANECDKVRIRHLLRKPSE